MSDKATKVKPAIIVVVGFMLFSMFFGAGNLVFPPQIGMEAGENYWPAILGFLSTGVLLPVLAVIAVAVSGSGVRDLANRTHPLFGLVFSVMVYLSIGALYAIPRTANVAFETGVGAITEDNAASPWWLLLFTAAFFAVSLWLSLRKGGIVDSLGRWLTPALLILILALVIAGAIMLRAEPDAPAEKWSGNAFATGFLEGYLTMDSLAALVFGMVVISSLRSKGVRGRRAIVSGTISAGVVAAVLLGIIYLGLGNLGLAVQGEFDNGAALLGTAAEQSFGTIGAWIFAAIVLLACLTTAVGLITSTAEYFSTLIPKLGYGGWAVLFTLAGLLVSNLGLDAIIAIAIPLNVALYPMAVTLVFITLLQAALPFFLRWTYRIPVAVSTIFAVIDLFKALEMDPAATLPWLADLPLYAESLAWVLPVGAVAVVTLIADWRAGLPAPARGSALEDAENLRVYGTAKG
ncbi:branched-chain amino acid transport system II carrier protein [Corynebacterium sp. 335C]